MRPAPLRAGDCASHQDRAGEEDTSGVERPYVCACASRYGAPSSSKSAGFEYTKANVLSARSWLARRIEDALREGFARAYETLRVDPNRYLFQLRTAHGLPIATFRGMATLPIEVVDEVADPGRKCPDSVLTITAW